MKLTSFCMLMLLCISGHALADGRVVDKVYHPYVQSWEREIEYRFAFQKQPDHPDNNSMVQKFGYGFNIADRMALEGYIEASRITPEDYQVTGYELELRWMLTEQGEYSADWGLLFELERQNALNNYELSAGLIMEKEFGPTSLTLNALTVYEWGETLRSELETEFRMQYRYRWMPEVQPAIEFYSGENYKGVGPALMGVHKFSKENQLKWEFATIFAIDNSTINNTLRFALEFEF
jgi:hypothetical protein